MIQRIKNIIRSWSTDDENNHEQLIIDEMKASLDQSQVAINELKDQLLIHEKSISELEQQKSIHEREATKLLKNNNKAQAEVSIAKMYRTDERLNHLRTIYTELSNSLGELEKNKQRVELKIHQFKNKKLVIKAKTLTTNNELEVTKNLSALEELNDLEALEDQLLEAQCLTEAFDNIRLEPEFEEKPSNTLAFQRKLQEEEKRKQEKDLERIAQMMGGSTSKKENNEHVRAKALAIQKEFEKNINTVNNTKNSDLLQRWMTENNNKEARHRDSINNFFSDPSNDEIINKFFN